MPNALSKVQKKVSKKKGGARNLHENSRDAQRLRTAGARLEKLEKLKVAKSKTNEYYVQRVQFFKDAVTAAKFPQDEEDVHRLIQRYIPRDEGELVEIQAQRRPGRPPNPREDVIKRKMEAEDSEYHGGFWVPDMQDRENLGRLLSWNGDWTSLNTIKYVRLARGGTTRTSTFPPNGRS